VKYAHILIKRRIFSIFVSTIKIILCLLLFADFGGGDASPQGRQSGQQARGCMIVTHENILAFDTYPANIFICKMSMALIVCSHVKGLFVDLA
jgi:hypothetical protein